MFTRKRKRQNLRKNHELYGVVTCLTLVPPLPSSPVALKTNSLQSQRKAAVWQKRVKTLFPWLSGGSLEDPALQDSSLFDLTRTSLMQTVFSFASLVSLEKTRSPPSSRPLLLPGCPCPGIQTSHSPPPPSPCWNVTFSMRFSLIANPPPHAGTSYFPPQASFTSRALITLLHTIYFIYIRLVICFSR